MVRPTELGFIGGEVVSVDVDTYGKASINRYFIINSVSLIGNREETSGVSLLAVYETLNGIDPFDDCECSVLQH